MKKFISLLLLITGVLVFGQNPEKILDDYYNSIGKNLDNVHSILQKGKMNINGMEFPMENYQDLEGRMYSKINMMGSEIVAIAFDGNKGYMFDNATFGYKNIPDSLAQKFKNKATGIFGEFYKYKEKGIQLKYLGLKKIGDTEYQAIEAHLKEPAEGDIQDFILYFDPQTHLLSYSEVTTDGKNILVSMEDYKNFDGYMFPSKIDTKVDGVSVTALIFDEIKINPPQPDSSIFTKPKN